MKHISTDVISMWKHFMIHIMSIVYFGDTSDAFYLLCKHKINQRKKSDDANVLLWAHLKGNTLIHEKTFEIFAE